MTQPSKIVKKTLITSQHLVKSKVSELDNIDILTQIYTQQQQEQTLNTTTVQQTFHIHWILIDFTTFCIISINCIFNNVSF